MEKKDVLVVELTKDTWVVTIKEDYAEIKSLHTALRYLIPVKK